MNDDRLDELITLAALGELTSAESRELDDALAADASARARHAAETGAAAAVQRLHRDTPPPSLRADVLGAISTTPQQPRHDPGPVAPTAADATEGDELASRRLQPSTTADSADAGTGETQLTFDATEVRSAGSRHRSRRRWMPLLAAAAAALVLVVGGIVLVTQRGSSQNPIEAVLGADDAVTVTMTSQLPASIAITHSAELDAMVLRATDLPPLPASRTYEVWLVDPAEPTAAIPAGIFRPDDDGTFSGRMDGVDPTGHTVALTEEPAGGSEVPTPPILART